jgi:hypothetical protein
VNAVGLFTTTASKKLLNKILHMHIDFRNEILCSTAEGSSEPLNWALGRSLSLGHQSLGCYLRIGIERTELATSLCSTAEDLVPDFQEFCSFCLLMRWCTKKQKLDGSNLQDSKLIPESIRKIMTLDLKDPTGIKYQIW